MNIVFLSNFMNHHQMPFCKALCAKDNIEFHFIATTPIPQERLQLGYSDINKSEDFVLCSYESTSALEKAQHLVDRCDVLIVTAAMNDWLKGRIKNNGLIFQYEERLYKDGYYHLLSPRHIWGRIRNHTRFNGKPMYTLCASAFCAWDLAICGSYLGKTFKWGYFPKTVTYNSIDEIVSSKADNTIFWAGRFIDWKHPEIPIEIARVLREHGKEFHMTMAGNGPMWDTAKTLIQKYQLDNYITLSGAMTPEHIRKNMEHSSIFLFTSDRNEGWGAVLNEAMNSGCAVVADSLIGSVPYLLNDKINGLIYKDKNIFDAVKKTEYLLDHSEVRKKMGINAYHTIQEKWNAEIAATRFVALSSKLLHHEDVNHLFDDGICSRAQIIPDWWY